jgi:hypothetical protein
MNISDITSKRAMNIVVLLKRADAGRITLHMIFLNDPKCVGNYTSPEIMFQAATILFREDPFNNTPGSPTLLSIPQSIADLGFADACARIYYAAYYGSFLSGNDNNIASFSSNITLIDQLVPCDEAEVCVSAISYNSEDSRNSEEDVCAQQHFGDAGQQREGFVTYFDLNATAKPDPLLARRFADVCETSMESALRTSFLK